MDSNTEISHLPVVMIGSFGHSGIDWIHSLLDNHEEILIMPPFSFFRTLEKIKRKNIILDKMKDKEISKVFSDIFYDDISYQIKNRNFINNEDQKKDFDSHFNYYLVNSKEKNLEKKIFFIIHYAFSKVHKIEIKKKKLILCQEHISWHCQKYKKIFNSKFLIIFRDPRATIGGAILKMKNSNNDQIINSFQFDTIILSMISAYNYFVKNINSDDLFYISNELMHQDLKKQMNILSKWLNIKSSESMYQQTFMGKKWKGESAYLNNDQLLDNIPINFYDPAQIEKRWRSILSKKEILMIETVFRNMMSKFQYKTDNKLNFLDLIKGYQYFFISHQHQQKYYLNKYLIIIRNIIRRFFVLLIGSKSTKFFRFK